LCSGQPGNVEFGGRVDLLVFIFDLFDKISYFVTSFTILPSTIVNAEEELERISVYRLKLG